MAQSALSSTLLWSYKGLDTKCTCIRLILTLQGMNALPCATMSCPKQRPRSSLQCIAEHPQVAAQPPRNEIRSSPSAGVWRTPRNWTFVWLGVGCLAPFSVCSLSSAPCSGCLRSHSTSQCSSDLRNKNMMSLLSIRFGALLQTQCKGD